MIEDWVIDMLDFDFSWLIKKYNNKFELHLRTDENKHFFYFVLN